MCCSIVVDDEFASPPLTLIDFCSRLPVLRTDDGQAHLTLLIDVRVVDASLEADLGWLKRVLGRERDFYLEGTLIIRWVLLQRTREATDDD